VNLLILSVSVAVISRIVTKEEIFIELRNWAHTRQVFWQKKLTYPLTCSFCFSVWVASALIGYVRWEAGFRYVFFSVLAAVGLANVFLVSYEYATVKIALLRQGQHLKNLTLEERRLSLEDYKQWRADQALRRQIHEERRGQPRPLFGVDHMERTN
jgi:hypothetical protein